jgi:hypothetical protein
VSRSLQLDRNFESVNIISKLFESIHNQINTVESHGNKNKRKIKKMNKQLIENEEQKRVIDE